VSRAKAAGRGDARLAEGREGRLARAGQLVAEDLVDIGRRRRPAGIAEVGRLRIAFLTS